MVRGSLPDCEANQMLQFIQITQPIKPDLITTQEPNGIYEVIQRVKCVTVTLEE